MAINRRYYRLSPLAYHQLRFVLKFSMILNEIQSNEISMGIQTKIPISWEDWFSLLKWWRVLGAECDNCLLSFEMLNLKRIWHEHSFLSAKRLSLKKAKLKT